MSNLGEEQVIFTTPDQGLIGSNPDQIDVRRGNFEVLTAATSFTTSAITTANIIVTNATVTNLTATSFVAATLGANVISPTVPSTGVLIDNALIRDQPDYSVANRSVSSLEGINPSSTNGVSVAIVPRGTGSIIGSIPDGTAIGGNTRGNYSVDLQLNRSTPLQVASGTYSVIVGGLGNTVGSLGGIIVGGSLNAINIAGATADYSVIVGGAQNVISATVVNSSGSGISGGGQNTIQESSFASIGGGFGNQVSTSDNSVIVGGLNNQITGGGPINTILGGTGNIIQSSAATHQTNVVSGHSNLINFAESSAISGGRSNRVSNCQNSTVGGGLNNIIDLSSYSFIAGGDGNTVSGGQQSAALGWGCEVVGTNCVGIGLYARPIATGAHVFASYSAYGGLNTASEQYSGNFIYDTIRTHVFTKEVHNSNTEVYYNSVNTIGPISAPFSTPLITIALDPFSSQHWDIMISAAGGNNDTSAAGRGSSYMYRNNVGNVLGSGYVPINPVYTDGGFGTVNFFVEYSGIFASVVAQYPTFGPLVRCNWTVSVRVQKSSRL